MKKAELKAILDEVLSNTQAMALLSGLHSSEILGLQEIVLACNPKDGDSLGDYWVLRTLSELMSSVNQNNEAPPATLTKQIIAKLKEHLGPYLTACLEHIEHIEQDVLDEIKKYPRTLTEETNYVPQSIELLKKLVKANSLKAAVIRYLNNTSYSEQVISCLVNSEDKILEQIFKIPCLTDRDEQYSGTWLSDLTELVRNNHHSLTEELIIQPDIIKRSCLSQI